MGAFTGLIFRFEGVTPWAAAVHGGVSLRNPLGSLVMDHHPLRTRFLKHALSLLSATALGLFSIVACLFLGCVLPGPGGWGMGLLMCFGAAGWMVGGLLVSRRYVESAPILFCAGAALAWWLLVNGGAAACGLFEFQSACVGGAIVSCFMPRVAKNGRSLTVGLAAACAVVGPVLVLQLRPIGDRVSIVNTNGESELVYVAHGAWGHGDIAYVRRNSSLSEEQGHEWQIVQGLKSFYRPPFRLQRIVDPDELELANKALRLTEAKLWERERDRGRASPLAKFFEWLRGDRRVGSVWKATHAEH